MAALGSVANHLIRYTPIYPLELRNESPGYPNFYFGQIVFLEESFKEYFKIHSTLFAAILGPLQS